MQMLVVGSRTGPIASAKTQVNGSVGAEGLEPSACWL